MPKGTTQTRLENIAKENATVTIEELNYDDCVRMAAKEAAETGRGVYELVLEHNILSKKDLDTILKPENMIKPVKLNIKPNK